MKNIFKVFLALFLLITAFSSCKKDENRITLTGGNAPELFASVSGAIPLSLANQNSAALRIYWTNPDYNFNTGVSSQNVNYTIEIDKADSNFSTTKKRSISLAREISYTFTQKELNTIFYNDFEFPVNVENSIEMRVIAGLGANNAAALNSNTLRFTVTPYNDPTLVPSDLYITGDATPAGWTNSPPASQKFTFLGSKRYEITMSFTPGFAYKFLTTPGQWQPQYGSASSTGGALQLNDGTTSDPPNINTPDVAGDYKITADLGAVTYTIVKL